MDLYKMGLRPTSPTRPVTPDCPRSKHTSRFGMWQKLQHFFGRDGSLQGMDSDVDGMAWPQPGQHNSPKKREGCGRPVGVGLPRQITFKRQNSEKRDRLCSVELLPHERRAYSTSRPGSAALANNFRSNSVPPISSLTKCSARHSNNTLAVDGSNSQGFDLSQTENPPLADADHPIEYDHSRPPRPPSFTSSVASRDGNRDLLEDRSQLNRDLDTKWILNLSMHFRDKSDREKFFVTYAETPSRWRRVTVSCDYRNAETGSLEMDLKELQLQRDKSMQIYEAIRESLLEIKFYETVTNLKLETTDGRLHVHVTEDVNEIIPYPPVSSLHHILNDAEFRPRLIRESELSFQAHLSGFVYKVLYNDQPYIKKEIPGPDTVDEFLYEVNALHALQDSQYVIDLEAIITDDTGQNIKGLLIDYAERGAVVDLLYDCKGDLPWEDRERWARHAIQGLSDIHEEGYVQGDFTLSNIVVDGRNNARIIDINRRGCPVGWEPPEIAKKIASNQRISMFIGQKTDLYQLGMTLWALAMDDDEPERHDPPLSTQEFPAEVPQWFQDIIRVCLSPRPRERLSATDLIKLFPIHDYSSSWTSHSRRPSVRIRTEKRYIDPDAAVERQDLERYRRERSLVDSPIPSPGSSRNDPTFTYPYSSSYDRDYDDASSEIERPRGRRRISDHDLMLQAQRRSHVQASGDPAFNNTHEEPNLVITISGDGTESHIVEEHDSTWPIEVDRSSTANDDSQDEEMSLRSTTVSPLPHPQDRVLFPNFSEASGDTPRNSDLQLFGYDQYSSMNRNSPTVRAGPVLDELAGLGGHPNVSVDSFERIRHTDDETPGRILSPIPTLPIDDSGYDEPASFGIDCEEDHSRREEDLPIQMSCADPKLHDSESAQQDPPGVLSQKIPDMNSHDISNSAVVFEIPKPGIHPTRDISADGAGVLEASSPTTDSVPADVTGNGSHSHDLEQRLAQDLTKIYDATKISQVNTTNQMQGETGAEGAPDESQLSSKDPIEEPT